MTLTEEQVDFLRWCLFDDLREIAERMAKDALGATDQDFERLEVYSDITLMSRSTSILDVIGWTRPKHAEAAARRRTEREGGK